MSWLFSQALAEEFSQAKYSDTESFALSKIIPIANLYCYNGKTKESFFRSQFGMILEPLTEQNGEELLIWYREAFLAKTFHQQDRAKDSTEKIQDYGSKCYEPFAMLDQVTHSWKIPKCLLKEDSIQYCKAFPKQGMMRNGVCWERTIAAHPTKEKECGYLPNGSIGDQKRKSPCLPVIIKMFPTPTVSGNHNRKGLSKNSGDGLATFVKKYPTPCTKGLGHATGSLQMIEKLFKNNIITEQERKAFRNGSGGMLNPNWVEWLMGLPIGHTDLEQSETLKSQSWQQWRSEFC
jgi:hypothetical protein